MDRSQPAFGDLLRDWRLRRRYTQLGLAEEAELSTRHLSWLETGRALPSREMVLRLAQRLDVPLRERNRWLVSAGFAPLFRSRPIDDPALGAAREAVEAVLRAHEPYPAIAVDRHWTMLASNRALAPLLAGVAPALLAPPVNVLRLCVHPDGLAPRIANLDEWSAHTRERLRAQLAATGDPVIADLLRELTPHLSEAGPVDAERAALDADTGPGLVVALRLRTEAGELSFFSTTMMFGTPVEITLAELMVELFFPADEATAERVRALADASA